MLDRIWYTLIAVLMRAGLWMVLFAMLLQAQPGWASWPHHAKRQVHYKHQGVHRYNSSHGPSYKHDPYLNPRNKNKIKPQA